MFDQDRHPETHLWRWFFFSGIIGILIALGLELEAAWSGVLGSKALVFWPSAAAGMTDPRTWQAKLLTAAVMFGGQFLLYGLVGPRLGYEAFVLRVLMKPGR